MTTNNDHTEKVIETAAQLAVLLEGETEVRLGLMARNLFRHELSELDYSPSELIEQLLEWADNGTVGFNEMDRAQLLDHLADNFLSGAAETLEDYIELLNDLAPETSEEVEQ